MKTRRTEPEVVLRDGKPAAVILDIEHYRELLERTEDVEDLRTLFRARHPRVSSRNWGIVAV